MAQQILAATGVQGGLIVHLGCGDAKLTAALRANDRYIVHGLDADSQKIEAARRYLQSQKLGGLVSVECHSGKRLPYIDNLVNLLVAQDLGEVPLEEVLRVLAPKGTAYIGSAGRWTKKSKPWPKEIDEWTHYLHDATGNAVAHDSAIGPLCRLQWIGGPRYSRHHDHLSAINAMVSANGRNFYIFDEAPRASILIPPQWCLSARDAFNGTLLWQRPLARWHPHLWPLKKGPQLLTRRLVAAGNRVYVTLSIDAPLSALDAATGAIIRTYEHTKATEEILYDNGVLFLSVAAEGQPLRSDPPKDRIGGGGFWVTDPLWTQAPRTLVAVEAESGKVLWKNLATVVAMSLTADSQRLLFHDGERIRCLDRDTGRLRWSSEPLAKQENMLSSGGVTIVLHDDVVLYSGQVTEEGKGHSTAVTALSATDGKILWKADHPPCGHVGTPDDIFVAGGLVWWGATAEGKDSGIVTGRDLHTGQIKKEFPPDISAYWFHHRCYRAKATDNYLLFSRTGIEFVDIHSNHWTPHHWVRGGCIYGIMPCNGLVYNPPHPCACYLEAKLYGFNALAPASKTCPPLGQAPDAGRLQRGPAYQALVSRQGSGVLRDDDWATYRHDPSRSGATKTTVPLTLGRLWETRLGGKLSSVTIAQGKLLVSSLDANTIHALDAESGKPVWDYTVGAPVDSPPTVWQGRVLFGSNDGYVYCLSAADGRLAWRFRAAPEERKLMAFERVESVWPVPGSVLVKDSVAWCVAGRSMFLDGGLRLLRLDATTGQKLSETIFDDHEPSSGENLQVQVKDLDMPVALPDVLSADDHHVYMRSLPFDLKGQRTTVSYVGLKDPVAQSEDRHLFSPTGLLDDSQWHRSYWLYGRAFASGANGYFQAGRAVPAGRLLVFDDETVYGYGRPAEYYRWSTPLEYHVYASKKYPEVVPMREPDSPARKVVGNWKYPASRIELTWSNKVAIQVNAMVLAGKTLFVAGPPEVVDEKKVYETLAEPESVKQLTEQEAAYEGRRGALLAAFSATDGTKLAVFRLEAMPTFDGMIAAQGRLYLSTSDGRVVCLGSDQGERRMIETATVPASKP